MKRQKNPVTFKDFRFLSFAVIAVLTLAFNGRAQTDLSFEGASPAAIFTVTNTNDSGAGGSWAYDSATFYGKHCS